MPDILYTFSRIEQKYLLTEETAAALLAAFSDDLCPDEWGESRIYSLYFDTPDHLLVRRSLEHPVYKEKLRLRSYGKCTPESQVFLELKKKCAGVGTKRRAKIPYRAALAYLETGQHPEELTYIDEQVLREIDYYRAHNTVYPKIYVSYVRNAFFGRDDPSFRVTFDSNILTRRYDLDLALGRYGDPALSPGKALIEVKFSGAVPLWFCRIMSDFGLSFHTFSKVGTNFKLYSYERAREAHPEEEHVLRLLH